MTQAAMAVQRFQMVAGITLDGRIAGEEGNFSQFSSPEDSAWLSKKIKESDVLIMGRKTFQMHVKEVNKPMIIFTRKVKNIQLGVKKLHFFNDQKQDLVELCDLHQHKTITILGGSQVYHWFLEKDLLTDIYLTLEPHLALKGLQLTQGKPFSTKNTWKLKTTKQLNDQGTLLLHYQKR